MDANTHTHTQARAGDRDSWTPSEEHEEFALRLVWELLETNLAPDRRSRDPHSSFGLQFAWNSGEKPLLKVNSYVSQQCQFRISEWTDDNDN